MELQEAISQELDENPALEMSELPTCPICGSSVAGNYCTECMPRKGEDGDDSGRLLSADDLAGDGSARLRDEADEFDPVAAGVDVTEEDVGALYDGVSECVDLRALLIDELAADAAPEQRACIDESVDDDLLKAFFVTALFSQGDPERYDLATLQELQVAIGPCLGG